MRHDAVAADAGEIAHRGPASRGVPLEKARESLLQLANDVGADGMIEHRGGAHLDRSASKQEIVQRVIKRRDAADAGKAPVGKSLRHLRHLRQRQRQDGRPAQPAGRDEAVDIDLEIERVRVDERQRGERVR